MLSIDSRILSAALFAALAIGAPAQAGPSGLYPDNPKNYRLLQEGDDADAAAAEEDSEEADKEKDDLPLEAARTVEFSTDEGTWLSLDVSPDGSTIVFEMLGDLYTMPATGGEATAITSSMAFDSQPVYSPDGEKIAFVSDRDGSLDLWVANADGSEPKQITKTTGSDFSSPAFSPDGEYIYVSQQRKGIFTFELFVYHIKGGSGVQLTKAFAGPPVPGPMRHNALGAWPSPDGKYLYYAQRQAGFSYNETFPTWQVVRRDLTQGGEDTIAQATGSAMRPALSPDGTLLVYATRHDAKSGLRLRNLETGEDRWLAYPVTRDDQESRATRDTMPRYDFTPDGSALIINNNGGFERIDIASGDISEIPFTADVSIGIGPDLHQQIRDETGPVVARLIQSPEQSPDGSRLAFSALGKVYVMDLAEGAVPERLTGSNDMEYEPTWSPDGRWITYVTWDAADGGNIWRMRSNGRGNPERLTEAAESYSSPVYAPDGSRIVAIRASNVQRMAQTFDAGIVPGGELIQIPPDGGAATVISHAQGLTSPHFSDDPGRLYAYTQGGLISMRLDGSDRRTHLQVTGPGLYFAIEPVPADDVRISPDRNWAMAHVNNQLYLVAVPHVGSDPVSVNVKGASVPAIQITDIGADYFEWTVGGDLTWAVGSTFYRQAMDTVEFEPAKEEKDESATDDESGDEEGMEAGDESEEMADADADAEEMADADEEEEAKPMREEKDYVESFRAVVSVPRDMPPGHVVLRGATVLTMVGDQVFENADILVEGSRIAGIGAAGTVDIPDDATVIDVTGKTIIPGFVDSHAHWFDIRRGVIDVDSWPFLANLAYGVTAGLDVQTGTNDQFAYQDMIDAGLMPGPRAYSTGPGVFSDNAFTSKEHAVGVLRRYRDHYRNHNIKAYISGDRNQRQWIAQAAKELGMMVTTEGSLDLKLDMTHALDGLSGTEHAFPIAPIYKDIVELVAQSGIGYTPTLLVSYGGPWAENYYYTKMPPHDDAKLNRFTPHDIVDQKTRRRIWFRDMDYIFPLHSEGAAKIFRSGGYIGVGSHGQLQGLGYHWELWSVAAGGMSPMEALKIATISSAHIIGREAEIGSLEPGKYADLQILDRDPREDLENTLSISRVMKNGRLYDAETLDEIYPRQRELPPLWFHGLEPDAE